MSKSSSNDDINIVYLEKLAEAVSDATVTLEKISHNYGSNGQLEKTLSALAQSVQKGEMTIKQMLKEGAAAQKNIRSVEYGLEDTARYNKTVNMFLKILEDRIGNSKVDDVLVEKLTTALENLDVSAILETERINERGGKGAPFKNVMDNEKLKGVNEDLAKRVGLKLDDAQYKLMAFFQEQEKRTDKRTRGFANELIEGLEKSKWVGGALRDTFRLVGLLGANFLSRFGQLGRVLGGAFYVAMEVAGPQLVNLLLQGMGKLLMNLPSFIGKFGWGNALGVTAGVVGAAWAFGEAKDSWGQGKKGNAVAFGTGGAAMGAGAAALGVAGVASVGATAMGGAAAGGLAATLSGIAAALGPIGWTLLAIGAAVAGIAFLWKKYGDDVKKHYKEHKEFYDNWFNRILDVIFPIKGLFDFIKWFYEHCPWVHGKDSSDPNSSAVNFLGMGGKGASARLLGGKTDSTNHLSLSKMTEADWQRADTLAPEYDEATGAIVNLGQMSQKRAAEVIKADIEAKGKNSYYEIADSSLVDKRQFKTDVADAENVYLVRGTSDRVRSELAKLQSLGYDTSGAKITAGIGSLGSREIMSPHRYKDSPTGHFGTTSSVDVGYIYKDGRRVDYNEYAKYLDRMEFGQSEGDHDHWAFGQFQWIADRAKTYKVRKQQVDADNTTAKMMAVHDLVKNLPEEDKRAFAEQLAQKTAEEGIAPDNSTLLKWEKSILGKMGISEDVEANRWVKKKGKGFETLRMDDSTGTYRWFSIVNTMQGATQGTTNGR